MIIKWKSELALFGLVSGFLSAAVLPVPAWMSGSVSGVLKAAAVPGLAFGLAVYLYLYFFEKIRVSQPKVLLWVLASAAGSLVASLFTFVSSGDGSPLLVFPSAIYFASGAIAALFIAIGVRAFSPLRAGQIFLLLVLGGLLSLAGVWTVEYFNLNADSRLPNYLFFEIWQIGMAVVLDILLHQEKLAGPPSSMSPANWTTGPYSK